MKDIKGYEGLYAATSCGKIYSYRAKKFLKLRTIKTGYYRVDLYKDGKRKSFLVHRLIAETYLPNPSNLPQVNHIDEDKTNNALQNLEFCDAAYNINYSKAKKVICLETQEVFNSVKEAAKVVNISKGNISNCLTDRQKTAAGLHWKYYEDEE